MDYRTTGAKGINMLIKDTTLQHAACLALATGAAADQIIPNLEWSEAMKALAPKKSRSSSIRCKNLRLNSTVEQFSLKKLIRVRLPQSLPNPPRRRINFRRLLVDKLVIQDDNKPMKNLIDYIWNCSAGEAFIIAVLGVWIAILIVEAFIDVFQK